MDTEAKLKILLDTSIPSHLFADDKPDWMAHTWRLWEKCKAGEYEIFVSPIFFIELNRCEEPKRGKMLDELDTIVFTRLEDSGEAMGLADDYIRNGAFAPRSINDSRHVAYAVVNGCDVILSWNFKDIVKQSTRKGVKIVNATSRYKEILIVSPDGFLKGGYK